MDEVEAAHPELKQPFERRIIQFRDFAPPRDGGDAAAWAPPAVAAAAASQPAASVGRPKGWDDPQTGTWLGEV